MTSAIYNSALLPEYAGNPLLEALPQMSTEEQILGALTRMPPYSDNERSLDSVVRQHSLDRILDVFQPQPEHVDIALTVSRLIRLGYKSRNPLTTAYNNLTYQLVSEESKNARPQNGFAQCRAAGFLMGLSGIGKSTVVERVLSQYSQVIVHTKYRDHTFAQTQVVWLKIDCPTDGSITQLCMSFYLGLDAAIGTDYAPRYSAKRFSVEGHISHVAMLAHTYHLGLLVIDELNKLTAAKKGGKDTFLNQLLTFNNTIGVPLFFMGTFESAKIFSTTFRNARRMTFAGPIVLDRYTASDPRWHLFVEAIWHYQWTRTPIPFTEQLSAALHEASQGITDIAITIYLLLQKQAIAEGKEVFSMEEIQNVVSTHLGILEPALSALRRSDETAYRLYDELRPPAEAWKQCTNSLKDSHWTELMLRRLRVEQNNRSHTNHVGSDQLQTESKLAGDLGLASQQFSEVATQLDGQVLANRQLEDDLLSGTN